MISTSCSEYIFPVGRKSTKDWTQLLNATWAFQFMTKKRGGVEIEVERNDGLGVPWGGQKSDQLSDERWARTAGHSDMGSDPRIQLAEECIHAKLLQLCLTLCDPMDCSPPGSSVHGILQARNWSGLPFPTPGDLPNPGIEPVSLTFPALTSRFFTTRAT